MARMVCMVRLADLFDRALRSPWAYALVAVLAQGFFGQCPPVVK